MTSSNVRFVSGRQLEVLWEFLNSHRDIAVACNRSLQDKEYSKQKWKEITEKLNSQREGTNKDWIGWSRYWVELKAKLKRKVAGVRSSQLRTGGTLSTERPLTDIDLKFLEILRNDYGQSARVSSIKVEVESYLENDETINEVFEDSDTDRDGTSPEQQESPAHLRTFSHDSSNTQHSSSTPTSLHTSAKRKMHRPSEPRQVKKKPQLKQDNENECSMFCSFIAKKLSKLSERDRDVMMAKILQLFVDERHNFSRTDTVPADESSLEFAYVDSA